MISMEKNQNSIILVLIYNLIVRWAQGGTWKHVSVAPRRFTVNTLKHKGLSKKYFMQFVHQGENYLEKSPTYWKLCKAIPKYFKIHISTYFYTAS